MPLPKELLDELGRRRTAESKEAERDKWRDIVVTALQCFAWSALGISLILWSAHTTDLTYGKAAFFGGLGIGNGGIIFTVLAAYRRGERRGDW
jgi:hypothetical protein